MVTSNGHNLDNDGSCQLSGTGDKPNASAILGPLQDNGGATVTHALLPGSQAIDGVGQGFCDIITDQRGVTRPQGTLCDIGAYEVAAGEFSYFWLPLIFRGS